jgi:hypothetical protein
VTFNLTATGPTASTYVTAWPGGATRPTASNLNVVAGETRPNLVTVAVGVDRTVQLYNNSGNVHLLADLTGFYTPDYGAEFVPLPPTRVLDTRAGTGLTGPLGPDLSATLDVTANVPVNATGVAMNLTGVGATTSTYVTAWGQLLIRPFESSTLNLVPGKAVPNAATVAFGKQRGIDFYNHRGSTHLIADLSGVFVVPSTDCAPGCVRAWGANDARKLGTSQTVPFSATPTPVVGLSAVRQVVGGGWDGTSYALLENGTVRAWGDNSAGQLGNGWVGPAGVGSSVPVPVVGLTSVTALSTKGYTTFALRSNGTVWGWGSGPLGNGASLSSSVPVPVSNLTGVVEVAAGGQATYALRTDGTVWAWGWNTNGELGTGSPAYPEALTPVRIPTLSGVVSVASGGNTGYAVKSDGTLWAWGWNGAGQLGNGQICDPEGPCESRVPVQVTGLTGVSKVTADGSNAYALRTDGTVAAWGDGNNGNLGDGVPCDAESCVTSTPVAVAGLTSVTSVATFEWGAYALRSDGTVWAWGDNTYQSLGDESVDGFAPTPVRVPGLSGIRAIGGAALAGYAIVANP